MKKAVAIALLCSIFSVHISHSQAELPEQQPPAPTQETTPGGIWNIRSIDSAKKFVINRFNCLIRGTDCSRQEELTMNFALGFLFGAIIPHEMVAEIFTRKGILERRKSAIPQFTADLLLTYLGSVNKNLSDPY